MKRSLGTALGLLTLLVAPVLPVHAARAPFYWEFLNVDIAVQETGDLLVTETQKYVFTAPYSIERSRWIPLDKVDRITDVQVLVEGQVLPRVTGVHENRFWIKWRHALTLPANHTFVIQYRVHGGLHIHPDGDAVMWTALAKDRAASIKSSTVTVRLPVVLAGHIQSVKQYGSVLAAFRHVDARTVEFIPYWAVLPGQELTVQVTFPHGMLKVPVPDWQQQRRAEGPSMLGMIVSAMASSAVFWTLVTLLALIVLLSFVRSFDKRVFQGTRGVGAVDKRPTSMILRPMTFRLPDAPMASKDLLIILGILGFLTLLCIFLFASLIPSHVRRPWPL